MIDVTLRSIHTKTDQARTADRDPLKLAEATKHNKYDEAYRAYGVRVVPLAFDGCGGCGAEAAAFIARLAELTKKKAPLIWSAATVKHLFIQIIGCATQRETARNSLDVMEAQGHSKGDTSLFRTFPIRRHRRPPGAPRH